MNVNPEGIPQELRDTPRWLLWRGKKVPYQANGIPASSTDPATWTTFDKAVAALPKFEGVALVLAAPYFGVDLDNCLDAKGEPYPKAAKIITDLASFTEVSPSGRGVHVIGRGRKPGPSCKRTTLWVPGVSGHIEIYDHARYFAFTGNVSPDAPFEVMECQSRLEALYASLWPKPNPVAVKVHNLTDAASRCWAYLEKCPDAISGQSGHDKTLRAACECMRFGLSDAETLGMMRRWSDLKSGGEPWNEREIEHKIQSARAKVQAEGEIGKRLRDASRSNGHAAVVHEPVTPPPAGASADVAARFARIADGTWSATPWCWPTLTALTQSLLPGTVTLLCGQPGAGKSFWMLTAAAGWLEAGIPFAMYELEEDRTYHLQRYLAILAENAKLTDLDWVKKHPVESDAARAAHTGAMDAMGRAIYDAPEKRVTLPELAHWYESVAPTARVVVIDPITAASAGERRWIEDGIFVERVKTIARQTETSLILVTHPRVGAKGVPTMDQLAGGADYARFTQTVLVLADRDPTKPVSCMMAGGKTTLERPNRVVHVHKARNGVGSGAEIGFSFNRNTLAFIERGVMSDADEE